MLAHRHCRRWTGRALLYGFNTFKGGVGGQFVGRDLGITNCTLNFPRLPSIAEILRVGRSRELAVYQHVLTVRTKAFLLPLKMVQTPKTLPRTHDRGTN